MMLRSIRFLGKSSRRLNSLRQHRAQSVTSSAPARFIAVGYKSMRILADNRLPLADARFLQDDRKHSIDQQPQGQSEAAVAEVMGNRPINPRRGPMDVTINGKTYQVEAEPDTPLLWVIRDELGMTGTSMAAASLSAVLVPS